MPQMALNTGVGAEVQRPEVRWGVRVEVRSRFHQLLLSRESVASAEEFVRFAPAMQEIAARRVVAGSDSALVLLVAESDVAQAPEEVARARAFEQPRGHDSPRSSTILRCMLVRSPWTSQGAPSLPETPDVERLGDMANTNRK